MGSLGRSVILAWISGGAVPLKVRRQRCASVAIENTPYIHAKLSPMHCRLPPPKGK